MSLNLFVVVVLCVVLLWSLWHSWHYCVCVYTSILYTNSTYTILKATPIFLCVYLLSFDIAYADILLYFLFYVYIVLVHKLRTFPVCLYIIHVIHVHSASCLLLCIVCICVIQTSYHASYIVHSSDQVLSAEPFLFYFLFQHDCIYSF